MKLAKHYLLILLLALCAYSTSSAQPLVITIDTAMSENADKSLGRALVSSLVLPGAGERYLGRNDRAKKFLFADLAFWGISGISYMTGELYLTNAVSTAERYAGAVNPPRDVDFLEVMGSYSSRGGHAGANYNPDLNEDYNQTMIRQGLEVDHKYPDTEKYYWDWGLSDNPQNEKNRDKFNNMLRNYRRSRIAFQAGLGALLLNRILSMVDVVQIYKATANERISYHLVPVILPGANGTAEISGASLWVRF